MAIDILHRYLALVCLMGDDKPTDKKAVVDYNVGVFQEALKKVFPRDDRDAMHMSPDEM